jgi:protein-tyrosine phosphatase
MPYRPGDLDGKLIQSYQQAGINIVVLLTPRREYLEITGRDLLVVYQDAGMKTVEMPIQDYSIPDLEPLEKTLTETMGYAQEGCNIAAHCHAGYGRTGTFLACLAVRALGFDGKQAIDWLRQHIPPALENLEQYQFVLEYGKKNADNTR